MVATNHPKSQPKPVTEFKKPNKHSAEVVSPKFCVVCLRLFQRCSVYVRGEGQNVIANSSHQELCEEVELNPTKSALSRLGNSAYGNILGAVCCTVFPSKEFVDSTSAESHQRQQPNQNDQEDERKQDKHTELVVVP